MKILHFTLRSFAAVCLAFFMSSASCELFQNADVITFNAKLDHTFEVTEEADFPNGKHYETEPGDEILDAADVNADFASHADKIESIKINSVTYVLSGYSSDCDVPVAFSNGSFTFSDPDAAGTGIVVSGVSHASLEAAQGTVHTLTFTQSEGDELANILKNKKKVRIHYAGDISCAPLFLTVKATLDCTINAKIL